MQYRSQYLIQKVKDKVNFLPYCVALCFEMRPRIYSALTNRDTVITDKTVDSKVASEVTAGSRL